MKPPVSRRLRSKSVRAALVGVSAFALAGCEEPLDLTFFENVDQCRTEAATSSEFSPAECEASFEAAQEEHAVLAPRYDELALCEEQHGEGACGTPEEAGGATAATHQGPSFMPFFMGYMMGSMLSNSSRAAMGRPLYGDTKGNWFSTAGQRMGFAGAGSTLRASPSALRAPAAQRIAAPMSRATVTARGGFGNARAAAFGG